MALASGTLPASSSPEAAPSAPHAWLPAGTAVSEDDTLAARFAPPAGFVREPTAAGSFAAWLRALPLKPAGSPVLLHSGTPKWSQTGHAAVVDIDTGEENLQQCADAIMRLRAEWQWAAGRPDAIGFLYTGGRRVAWSRWARGERPNDKGTAWRRAGAADASYTALRRYLRHVYTYAGTYSLERELVPSKEADQPDIGDVIVMGGFPGHAVLVADVVIEPLTSARRFLLVQSYMPAQDIHVLKDPASPDGSPWFSAPIAWPLATPDWVFPAGSLKRWP
ncbi:MAG: DUF4846 domain-containing protein [Hyphomicrobiaceae bacterium]|nr:DUF4846 domain-containing protein [Hyphomicrobiaceae bacterium]